MKGYIKNISPLWRHALKRTIGPGEKIPLDELYNTYGVKHAIIEGKPFIDWLREIKLRDRDVWEIMYKEEDSAVMTEPASPAASEPVEIKKQAAPFVKQDMTVEDIVGMSVRQLRETLDKITDSKVLKYALSKASQLQDKETTCKMLRKRIQLLELSRRM